MTNTSRSNQLYSKEEAASYLGVSLSTLNRLILKHCIMPMRVGNRIKFSKDQLNLFNPYFSENKFK
jgi:excisionase family DNA binding protein